jgi:N,N'-diacetyllegionaminate synthase
MKPFVIAEIGVNHNGNLESAIQLIDAAKNSGADAVKFQSFSAERISSIHTPKVPYQEINDFRPSHFQMLKDLELSFKDQEFLFDYCNSNEIEFLSTPYSIVDANFLQNLGVNKFKIASADIVDLPLNEVVASFGKLTLISTGMATETEISQAISFYENRNTPFVLLHTTSEYPTTPNNVNLNKLERLRKFGSVGLGFSDHSQDSISALVSVGFGCRYFEKHLTLDKKADGPDHAASCDPAELKSYVDSINYAFKLLGSHEINKTRGEESMALTSRKSLHFSRAMVPGEILREKDLKLLRPGKGILWSERSLVLGRVLSSQVSDGEFVENDLSQFE